MIKYSLTYSRVLFAHQGKRRAFTFRKLHHRTSPTSIVHNEVVSKYFRDDSNRVAPSTVLSPSVVESMVDEALLKNDKDTLSMLLPQTLNLGRPGVKLVEKVIRRYTDQKEFFLAVSILERCDPYKIALSHSLCNDLVVGAVNFLRWHEAFIGTLYMITHDMKFSDRVVYFTAAGLMNDSDGLYKVLDLMNLILDRRREDLGKMFNFGKINEFATSMGVNRKNVKRYQLETALKKLMDTWIREASNGFRSFPIAKMIVAIACVGKIELLASSFIKQALEICAETENCGYDLDDKDALSLLRAFSQGNGLALNLHKSGSPEEPSLVTCALLECIMKHCKSAADGSLGIMKCLDFFTNYWVLASRLRGLPRQMADYYTIPDKEVDYVHSLSRSYYNKLIEFLKQDDKIHMEMSAFSRAERRNLRILCEKLGLKHKIIENQDRELTIVVSKQGNFIYDLPSFNDLIERDSCVTLDGAPLFWDQISTILRDLDESILSVVALKLSATMKNLHPSPTWLLLLSQHFRDRGIPLPPGFLKNAIKMCGKRNDVYGLVEILQLSSEEVNNSNSKEYQQAYKKMLTSGYYAYEEVHNLDTASGVNGPPFRLSTNDWNNACFIAYLSKPFFTHQRSFQEAFMEVMGMRRKNQIEIDAFTADLLLKFLSQNMINRHLLKGLLARVYKRCTTDETSVERPSSIECLAASKLLLSNMEGPKMVQFSLPMFKNEHYLQIIPCNVQKIADKFVSDWILDDASLGRFESAWNTQNTSNGRRALLDITLSLINRCDSNMLGEIPVEHMHSLYEMVIFVGYLLAAYDRDTTNSFRLLYSTIEYASAQTKREE